MVSWNTLLYMDKLVKLNPSRYRKCFEKKGRRKAYCIAIAENKHNSLEIYDNKSKWYLYRRKKGIHIVGMAVSYESALLLVADIVSDVANRKDRVDTRAIREYFSQF